MTNHKCFLALAAMLLLGGCGMADDPGDGSVDTPTATPTPTPTPVPTPTPTPTPSPVATTYDPVRGVDRDRRWTGYELAVRADDSNGDTVSVALSHSLDAISGFDLATGRLTFAGMATAPGGGTYGPGTGIVAVKETNEFGYRKDDPNGFEAYIEYLADRYKYMAVARYRDDRNRYDMLFGAPALPVDLAGLTELTFASLVDEDEDEPNPSQRKPFTVDLAKRTVGGSIAVSGEDIVYEMTGTVDPATGRITGTFKSTDGKTTGSFAGRLFGPAAREIGLLIEKTVDGERYVSEMYGSRD